MRKKSHVSLAGYLVRGLGLEELRLHKKAFYLGSVMPDLNPRMLAEPHEYDTTYGVFQALCRQLLDEMPESGESGRVLWRRAGVIMHYLADYFTYPHNTLFDGTLKDHCMYESEMKYRMRVLVWMPESQEIFKKAKEEASGIGSLEELFAYIAGAHRQYMSARLHSAEADCRQILLLCAAALVALTELIAAERAEDEGFLCA